MRVRATDQPEMRVNRSFRRLISIDIRHEHFNNSPDRRFGGITVAPTDHTAMRLERFGMLVRQRPDGIDILYGAEHAETFGSFLEALHTSFGDRIPSNIQNRLFWPPLLFTLKLTNPLFFNFTEVPTSARCGKPALWLSNRRTVSARGGTDTEQPPAPQSARLAIDWSDPKALVLPTDPPKPKARSARKTASDAGDPQLTPAEQAREMVDEEHVPDSLKRADSPGEWWFDSLGGIDAAKKERREMKAGLRPRPLPFGFVEIFLAPQAGARRPAGGEWNGFPLDFDPDHDRPSGAIVDAGGHIRPSTYEIRFEARRTRWRYLVAGRGRQLEESNFRIEGPAGAQSFDRKEKFILPNGASAIRFESREALPLVQRPEGSFALHGLPAAGSGRVSKLIDPLPSPTADLILPDPHPPPDAPESPGASAAGGKAWSEIYVFV